MYHPPHRKPKKTSGINFKYGGTKPVSWNSNLLVRSDNDLCLPPIPGELAGGVASSGTNGDPDAGLRRET